MWIVTLLAVWVLILFVVGWVGLFGVRLTKSLWPSAQIQVSQEAGSQSTFSPRFLELWRTYTLAAQHSDNIQFAEDLHGVGSSVLHRTDQKFDFSQLTLQIKGIDVGGLLKAIHSMAEGPARKLEGTFSSTKDSRVLAVTLSEREGTETTWQFVRPISVASGVPSEDGSARDGELVEDAVFLLLHRERGPLGTDPSGSAFESPRALRSYLKGRLHLSEYFRSHDPRFLENALTFLRELAFAAPSYVDGQLLYGIALSEARREAEAIDVFEHVQQALPADDQRLTDVKFLIGRALLKQYDKAPLLKSLALWKGLQGSLEAAAQAASAPPAAAPGPGPQPGAAPPGATKPAAARLAPDPSVLMRARVTVERAHALGHALVLFKAETDRPAGLGDVYADLVSLDPGLTAWPTEVFDAQQKLLRKVDGLLKGLPDSVQRRVVQARRHEADGYARFRRAELLPFGKDDEFTKDCEYALRELHAADALDPRRYALLQNIGLVYASSRFDPSAEQLLTAHRYFQMSVELKPTDYFGHFQLALTGLRLCSRTVSASERLRLADGALASVQKALALRERSALTALAEASCLLEVWRANDAPEGVKDKEVEKKLDALSGRLDAEKGDMLEYYWDRAVLASLRVRSCPPSPEGQSRFKELQQEGALQLKAMTDLLAKLPSTRWSVHRLTQEVQTALDRFQSAAFEARSKMALTAFAAIK